MTSAAQQLELVWRALRDPANNAPASDDMLCGQMLTIRVGGGILRLQLMMTERSRTSMTSFSWIRFRRVELRSKGPAEEGVG